MGSERQWQRNLLKAMRKLCCQPGGRMNLNGSKGNVKVCLIEY